MGRRSGALFLIVVLVGCVSVQVSPSSSAPQAAWLRTWSQAEQEAERTGRPVLLVFGSPRCAGVPGVW